MMMSRPESQDREEESVPDFAVSKAEAPKKKSAQSTVEDLERRLAMLGDHEDPPPALPEPMDLLSPNPDVAAPPADEAKQKPIAKGGKNALLARIMAAQERTRQQNAEPAPLPAAKEEDLLSGFDDPPPDISTVGGPPPPAFDMSFIPPPSISTVAPPPPTFDMLEQNTNFPAPPPMEAVAPPPMESFAPSAPAFEDLLEMQHNHHPTPMQPPPLSGMEAVPPPSMDIDEDVLGALDPEERAALLDEQRRIMEQIEANKANDQASSATARAMAFDQRSAPAVARAAGSMSEPTTSSSRSKSKKSSSSSSASRGDRTVDLGSGQSVPLHGQEMTKQAIKDGTAAMVQCVNCSNWMQVTKDATLMFCPVCQVVSPVVEGGTDGVGIPAVTDSSQMDADQRLAEQLQQEEYKQAGADSQGRRSTRTTREEPKEKKDAKSQSWYDWLVGAPAAAPAAQSSARERRDRSESPPPGGLLSAHTGEERRRYRPTNSYEGIGGGGARVAEQKSMFACVADSMTTAVSSMGASTDGDVNGVDSSSLLAMPQVSRQRE